MKKLLVIIALVVFTALVTTACIPIKNVGENQDMVSDEPVEIVTEKVETQYADLDDFEMLADGACIAPHYESEDGEITQYADLDDLTDLEYCTECIAPNSPSLETEESE